MGAGVGGVGAGDGTGVGTGVGNLDSAIGFLSLVSACTCSGIVARGVGEGVRGVGCIVGGAGVGIFVANGDGDGVGDGLGNPVGLRVGERVGNGVGMCVSARGTPSTNTSLCGATVM